eukprot:6160366-Pleurochrysis_carterae.AAC.1
MPLGEGWESSASYWNPRSYYDEGPTKPDGPSEEAVAAAVEAATVDDVAEDGAAAEGWIWKVAEVEADDGAAAGGWMWMVVEREEGAAAA